MIELNKRLINFIFLKYLNGDVAEPKLIIDIYILCGLQPVFAY